MWPCAVCRHGPMSITKFIFSWASPLSSLVANTRHELRVVYTVNGEPWNQSAGLPASCFTSSLPKDAATCPRIWHSAPFFRVTPMQWQHCPLQSQGHYQVCRVGGVHTERFRGWNPQNYFSEHLHQKFHHLRITGDLKIFRGLPEIPVKVKMPPGEEKYRDLIILKLSRSLGPPGEFFSAY